MKKIILAAIALVACFAAAHAAPRKDAGVQERPKLMWFDLSANWARFSSADSIEYYVEKCREAGFNHLIVDVKGTASEVAYPSEVAPRLTSWKGVTRPDGYDFLQLFIDAAHRRGMKVLASFNVFCEGHGLFKKGITYNVHSDCSRSTMCLARDLCQPPRLRARPLCSPIPRCRQCRNMSAPYWWNVSLSMLWMA